jgi:ribonuclease HI
MHDPYALKIYVDGSAYRNPGHEGGLAGVAEFPDNLDREPEIIFEESYGQTTNNRMELQACLRALNYVEENARRLGVTRAIIFTDSRYVHENTKFAPFWRKNGWTNRHCRPVENKDLWKEFLSLRTRTQVRTDIEWNPGKSSAVLNLVDSLAKRAAKSPIKDTDFGYRPGAVSRHRTEERGAATLFPANNQELIIRVYAHYLAGREDGRVSFSVFSEEENKFVRKHRAYVRGRDLAEIHRHHCYRVRFNDDPQFPIFEIIEMLGSRPALAKPIGTDEPEVPRSERHVDGNGC